MFNSIISSGGRAVSAAKKTTALLLAAVLLLVPVSGCGGGDASGESENSFTVIATLFPYYDFAKNLCGDDIAVQLLVPPGTDSHSYEPTPKDISAINSCDLFIYTGGEEDAVFTEILSAADGDIAVLKLIDFVAPITEELTEGMEGEADGEYDPHIWTSPANAKLICAAISDRLSILCPSDSGLTQRLDAYTDKLDELDKDFAAYFSEHNEPLIFGDRFPFRYFVEEYGVEYYAAFPGCASYTEPSAKTIKTLTEKAREYGVTTVYYAEGSDTAAAESIAAETGTKTALLHSCHRVTRAELDAGVSYISLMERNLETLRAAE